MLSRREYVKASSLALAACAVNPSLLVGSGARVPITRQIPSSGERISVVGLGGLTAFNRSQDQSERRAVLAAMLEHGGTVVDTGYGTESRITSLTDQMGITRQLFWSTKIDGTPDGQADGAQHQLKVDAALRSIRKAPLDLMKVQLRDDVTHQVDRLKDLKSDGRVRYIGIATTSPGYYAQLPVLMRNEPIDVIAIDFAIDNRWAEELVLPLAADQGIAVIVYQPFGAGGLLGAVREHRLPEWAVEFDAHSWAQFFMKYIVGHPAVTVVTPGTSRVQHMIDNMGAAFGRVPDSQTRARMVAHIDSISIG